MDDLDPDRRSLDWRLPAWVELRMVVVAPGQRLAYDPAAWCDAVVVVEDGELEVEWLGGSRQRFLRGDVLCLSGLPLRALHSPGRAAVVLTVVSRRQGADESRAGWPSQQ
jgi:hypothetical protein